MHEHITDVIRVYPLQFYSSGYSSKSMTRSNSSLSPKMRIKISPGKISIRIYYPHRQRVFLSGRHVIRNIKIKWSTKSFIFSYKFLVDKNLSTESYTFKFQQQALAAFNMRQQEVGTKPGNPSIIS